MTAMPPALMTCEEINKTARLCSRLCHDLISPVGAIANGIEILLEEDDAETRTQVIEMLADSARVTSAKLQFFRFVFGASGGATDPVPSREVKEIADTFMSTGKAELDWQIDSAQTLERSVAKAMLIAVMAISDALVRGGRVHVGMPQSGAVRVHGSGDRVLLDEDVAKLLVSAPTEDLMTSRNAPILFFLSTLQGCAYQFALTQNDGSISIEISPSIAKAA